MRLSQSVQRGPASSTMECGGSGSVKTMKTKRFERLKELFHGALERDLPERHAFLEEACRDDPELRARVERLLETDAIQDGFLEAPPLGEPRRPPPPPGPGTVIHGYRLLKVISSGGMGIVYEALKERPHRKVALKLMRGDLVSPSTLRRFEYEARILANLRHPGIAQVIEAGTFDPGGGEEEALPYLVMEFIPNATPYSSAASLYLPSLKSVNPRLLCTMGLSKPFLRASLYSLRAFSYLSFRRNSFPST